MISEDPDKPVYPRISSLFVDIFESISYDYKESWTVEPRYLELAYFELPLISKWKIWSLF